MILRQVDELDLECEENNDMRVIDEQVKFYKDEVNKILVEFRDLDQNGVCYSLFSNKSEELKRLGEQLEQEIKENQNQYRQQIQDQIDQYDIEVDWNYQQTNKDIVVLNKAINKRKEVGQRNTLITDLTLIDNQNTEILDIHKQGNRWNNNMNDNMIQNQQQFNPNNQQLSNVKQSFNVNRINQNIGYLQSQNTRDSMVSNQQRDSMIYGNNHQQRESMLQNPQRDSLTPNHNNHHVQRDSMTPNHNNNQMTPSPNFMAINNNYMTPNQNQKDHMTGRSFDRIEDVDWNQQPKSFVMQQQNIQNIQQIQYNQPVQDRSFQNHSVMQDQNPYFMSPAGFNPSSHKKNSHNHNNSYTQHNTSYTQQQHNNSYIHQNSKLIGYNKSSSKIQQKSRSPMGTAVKKKSKVNRFKFRVEAKFEPEMMKLKNETADFVDLTQADLGDNGMAVIGEEISFNSRLTNLKLTKNKISDNGFSTFFDYMGQNQTLQTISFASNELTEKALDILISFYSSNPQTGLRNINLCGNNKINGKKLKDKIGQVQRFGVNVSTT